MKSTKIYYEKHHIGDFNFSEYIEEINQRNIINSVTKLKITQRNHESM